MTSSISGTYNVCRSHKLQATYNECNNCFGLSYDRNKPTLSALFQVHTPS